VLHRGAELEKMGSAGTYHSARSGWANASNTPWSMYKHYSNEGGISSPCLMHWPVGIKRRGTIESTPAHLIDLMERDGLVGPADGSRPRELLKAPGWLHEISVAEE